MNAFSRHPTPKLYTDLASWFHLFSPPTDYTKEAEFYHQLIAASCATPPKTLLELGSGGGNNASFMKAHFQLTLTDISPDMLAISKTINPECEHIVGDMRSLRLGRFFDAVFIHDAISYMTSKTDLLKAIQTAYVHCRAGGMALFTPDYTRETFSPTTDHGGQDGDQRGIRYLEWTWDPDPTDCLYRVDFAYLIRDENGEVHVEHDQHQLGLFARADWLQLITEAGFEAKTASYPHGITETDQNEVFIGIKNK